MAKPPKESEKAEDKQFKKVVQHFLNTPPKPHKPKGEKPRKKGKK